MSPFIAAFMLMALLPPGPILWTWSFFAIPYLAIAFGTQDDPLFRVSPRVGDMSYGIYVHAFPLQQTVYYYLHSQLSFWPIQGVSAAATILCSYLSWHWIENPALRMKPAPQKNYVRSSLTLSPAQPKTPAAAEHVPHGTGKIRNTHVHLRWRRRLEAGSGRRMAPATGVSRICGTGPPGLGACTDLPAPADRRSKPAGRRRSGRASPWRPLYSLRDPRPVDRCHAPHLPQPSINGGGRLRSRRRRGRTIR